MTSDPDLARAVRSWLDEGADRLPERVLDAVLDAVPTTHQRRPWWPVWRFTIMSTAARAGLGAALVAGALLVAIAMLGTGGGAPPPAISPSPSPTAPPTPSVTPSPTEAALGTADEGRPLIAGTHRIDAPFGVPYSITLPAGFTVQRINAGETGFHSDAGFVGVLLPDAVFPDPCRVTGSPAPATTVAELETALKAMAGFSATDDVVTTIDGHPARSFLLNNSVDTANAGCTQDLMLPLFTVTGGSPDGVGTNGGMAELFYLIDVDGTPVLIAVDGWTTTADRDALKAIAEAIRFE